MASERKCNLFSCPDVKMSLSSSPTLKTHSLRPSKRRTSLLRRSPRKSSRLSSLKRSSSVLSVDGGILQLFSCPSCGFILRQPVTLECGHTVCKSCLLGAECPECGRCVETDISINVLVRSIVNKLVGDDSDDTGTDASSRTSSPTSHFFRPPYNLRFRNTEHANKKILRPQVEEAVVKTKYILTNSLHNEERNLRGTTAEASSKDKTTEAGPSYPVLTPQDLECVLCCRCLHEPVTTHCGHTFCRNCLDRVLDHGLSCPLCMAPLSPGAHLWTTTYLLDAAVQELWPREYRDRMEADEKEIEAVEKDTQVPVFICTSAFPGVACPLYVYEPRYRLLTRRCLQSHRRRFAMAASSGTTSGEKFASFGTLLEVRDAVHLRDGRSILTTVGLRRFRVIDRDEKDGYDTATVEYIRDHPVPSHQLHSLRALHEKVHRKAVRWVQSLAPHVQAEIEQSLGTMPALEHNWASLPDGPAWAWWLMPVLPLSSQLQVGFLSTASLEKRLKAIEKMLERMTIRMRDLKRNEMCERREENIESCSNTNGDISLNNTRQAMEL